MSSLSSFVFDLLSNELFWGFVHEFHYDSIDVQNNIVKIGSRCTLRNNVIDEWLAQDV